MAQYADERAYADADDDASPSEDRRAAARIVLATPKIWNLVLFVVDLLRLCAGKREQKNKSYTHYREPSLDGSA